MMSSAPEKSVATLSLIALAAGVLLIFHWSWTVMSGGLGLDLGSLNFPTPRYLVLIQLWTLFGSVSALLLAAGLARLSLASATVRSWAARWNSLPESRFLVCAAVGAFLIPIAVQQGILKGAPLTDDEGAYRFGAELLASRRLWIPSPPLKLFFDQNFMINDGQLYPAYFLGWPALLAIGVAVNATSFVNPILSALTVPAIYRVVKHLASAAWARVAILVLLTSPFIQIAAATLLSHTACLMALSWGLALFYRTTDPDASTRHHAGFAVFLCLAFFIRPQSTAPLTLPLVLSWASRTCRLPRGQRASALLAFLVPVFAAGVLFVATLWYLNGSPLTVGYARYNRYIVENDFRFTTFRPTDLTSVPGFDFSHIALALFRTLSGVLRLNFDLFGWPSSLAFLAFALPRRVPQAKLLWWMIACQLGFMWPQRDWGIDTFGPLHALELALPVIVLTMLGAMWSTETLRDYPWQDRRARLAPIHLLAAVVITGLLGFVPIRLAAISRVAHHVGLALGAPEHLPLRPILVFASTPFAPPCGNVPAHFVFFRPVNDPDLRNDVLWVNHLGDEEDRALADTMPHHQSFVLEWTPGCDVRLRPLRN